MQNSSQTYENDLNEDVFEDQTITNSQLNHSSSDIKLRRTNQDSSNYPVLHRALSTVSANQTLVHNQRNVLAKNFRRISVNDEIVTIDHMDADASFLLPNLFDLPEEIRTRVMDSLVDLPTMQTLEETKRLNWWDNKKLPCPKLYPLLTSGDGNCLLHATSLAMWGFHDHSLSMRKALNETMITSKPNNSLYRRWRWAQSVQNKKYGLVFSEQEWNEEWKGLLRLSSAEPRISQMNPSIESTDEINRSKTSQTVSSGGSTKSSSQSTRQYYESLEEFHVYVLANNIRRPIIVYSDTVLRTNDGEAISPIEFGGIYLPLEIPPEKCHKQPVFLAFDAAHFSALVPMEQNSKPNTRVTYRIPLIDIEAIDLLPIHFFVDPGPEFAWPIDGELSDEKIHLYTNYSGSRMETLENYLNLSKEHCALNTLIPSLPSPTTANTNTNNNNINSTVEEIHSTNESHSISDQPSNETIIQPVLNKKLTRPSLNSFSKIIRRTFLEPFASVKRASLKQARSNQQSNITDASTINENEQTTRRTSSPLINRRTNLLTIIVTNFQPKRPKTCDNMIKNYIDACMNEYRLEKARQQLYDSEKTDYNSMYDKPLTTNRQYTSTTRKLPAIPTRTQTVDFDDNDDSLPNENGQFSSNINYVQATQKKTNQQLAQTCSLETSNNRSENHINGNGNHSHRIVKLETPVPNVSSTTLKRQQSLTSEKAQPNRQITRNPTTATTTTASQIKRTIRSNNNPEQQKRF